MIAQAASILLPALFMGSGALGLTVLVQSWRTYGGAFRRLQRELADCGDSQAVTVTLARYEVRVLCGGTTALPAIRRPALRQPNVARPGFSPARLPVPALPVQPAAA